MIVRIVQDQRCQSAHPAARVRAKPAAVVRPPVARRRQRIGVKKNMEERIRNRNFKIKRLLAQPKNADVKKNAVVVRKTVVRRKTIIPAEVREAQY